MVINVALTLRHSRLPETRSEPAQVVPVGDSWQTREQGFEERRCDLCRGNDYDRFPTGAIYSDSRAIQEERGGG